MEQTPEDFACKIYGIENGIDYSDFNIPLSSAIKMIEKYYQLKKREIFNAGFDEGYTNPMEIDGKTITDEEYKEGREKNYLLWLDSVFS